MFCYIAVYLGERVFIPMTLVPFLIRVSITTTNYHDKNTSWRGKGLFGLHFHITVRHQRLGQELKQVRNVEARADAEAAEGRYLLTCSIWLTQPAMVLKPEPLTQG